MFAISDMKVPLVSVIGLHPPFHMPLHIVPIPEFYEEGVSAVGMLHPRFWRDRLCAAGHGNETGGPI